MIPSTPTSRRRWRLGIILGALVLVGLVVAFWPRDPYALPTADWRLFKKQFLSEEGRIVDTGNGGISHSEGQGYGMLLAVAFHDRPGFDRIWQWTLKHLKRKEDFLFSWQWLPADGGKVGDPNNASDGDLLIAWALERAYLEWGDLAHRKAASQILASFLENVPVDTYLGMQMLPGVEGFVKPDGVLLNPSYALFPAFAELKKTFASEKWDQLDRGGRLLVRTARFSEWALAPDWAFVGTNWVAIGDNAEPVFGYNAIRVPLNIAWQNPDSPLLAEFADFWEKLPTGEPVPAVVDLKTGEFGPHPALAGMLAVRDLTLACVKKYRITVRSIPPVQPDEAYYSASLKLLTKLAIRERFGPKRN